MMREVRTVLPLRRYYPRRNLRDPAGSWDHFISQSEFWLHIVFYVNFPGEAISFCSPFSLSELLLRKKEERTRKVYVTPAHSLAETLPSSPASFATSLQICLQESQFCTHCSQIRKCQSSQVFNCRHLHGVQGSISCTKKIKPFLRIKNSYYIL